MTALKEYARLESGGLWRPAPDAQRREVGVSFGEATLIITDSAGRPLAHWSLPAIERLEDSGSCAVFAPDADGTETLEIDDDLMTEAIDRVRRSVARSRARPGRLRQSATWAAAAAMIGLAVLWFPGALERQTLSVVPPAKRSEIGATILGHLQRVTGPACREPLGLQALSRLHLRVLGRDAPGQIVVVPGDLARPLYLPGGIIVLSRGLLDATWDPAVIAGHLLSAATGRAAEDPLAPLLDAAGLRTTLTLLTTGTLPPDVPEAHARRLLTDPAPGLAPDAELIAAFELARVPLAPWAEAVGRGDLVAADRLAGQTPPQILSDGDWISLLSICDT